MVTRRGCVLMRVGIHKSEHVLVLKDKQGIQCLSEQTRHDIWDYQHIHAQHIPSCRHTANMQHTIHTLTSLFVHTLVIRCIIFFLFNEIVLSHYIGTTLHTTLLYNQNILHKHYFETCFQNDKKTLTLCYTHCKHNRKAPLVYNNGNPQEDCSWPKTNSQLRKALQLHTKLQPPPPKPTLRQLPRKFRVGAEHQIQTTNGSPKLTWNQMRQATPTTPQFTTKHIQSPGPPLGATKHPTLHKELQPRQIKKSIPRPTRRSRMKRNPRVHSALTVVQLTLVRQEAPQKKKPAMASQAIRSPPTATQRTTNINSKKVSPPRSHSQFSQPPSKTTRSSCEEPLDPTHTESNDDQRNPSHKLPRAIPHQEAPQPVESWHQHHPSRRRKFHKRTTLNTPILPHSEARAEVRIKRERPQIVKKALPTEHPEIRGVAKASGGGKIRNGSVEETKSERSEHETPNSVAENEVPKPRISRTHQTAEPQKNDNEEGANIRRHYRGNTGRSDPAGRRTAPEPKNSNPHRQEPAPNYNAED